MLAAADLTWKRMILCVSGVLVRSRRTETNGGFKLDDLHQLIFYLLAALYRSPQRIQPPLITFYSAHLQKSSLRNRASC